MPTPTDWAELEAAIALDGFDGREALVLKSDPGRMAFAGNGSDDYGFSALPAGYVSAVGTPTGAGVIANWASSATDPALRTRTVVNSYGSDEIEFADNSMLLGAGVQLVRYAAAPTPRKDGKRPPIRDETGER